MTELTLGRRGLVPPLHVAGLRYNCLRLPITYFNRNLCREIATEGPIVTAAALCQRYELLTFM